MNGKYIIAAITPKNGKHNFYHDDMRGSICEILSAEIGEEADIKYLPNYDNLYHYVTTTKVASVEERNGILTIETKNTIYTLHAVSDANFTSIWDGGFAITTGCKANMATKEVFDIEVSDGTADMVNELDKEYITIDGKDYPVFGEEDRPEEQECFWYR